jgi:shikimate kinase/3-dehydroquinate synthase
MPSEPPRRIFLTGFSFTGKSKVAPLAAAALGWKAIDLDDLIEREAAKPITAIFAEDGEPGFRARETEALRQACRQTEIVVATGGGIVLSEENRRLMAEYGIVICLEARPESILARMQEPGGEESERPLLGSANPLARVRHLKALRQPLYALTDVTVHTDGIPLELVAEEVERGWRRFAPCLSYDGSRLAAAPGEIPEAKVRQGDVALVCEVKTETASYPVYAGWEIIESLGEKLRETGLGGTVYLITDSNLNLLYADRISRVVADAGFEVQRFVIPAGEASKTLEQASRAYDWLTELKTERSQPIVALGGGVVGDLAGFVAATYLRGLPFVQVPTSLVAMVDASIGGKVAVDQRQAKNLVGAFYQPRLVFGDVSLLKTLPERELTSGWAEVVKQALITDGGLLSFLESQVESLRRLEPQPTTETVRRSMILKAQVVAEDERETTGRRTILNYGHTAGHALEAATGYGALLHGEAIAWGMLAAGEIGHAMGLTPKELVERQDALLRQFGLLRPLPPVSTERLMGIMSLDKKVSERSIRWVLLEDVGKPVLRNDVPLSIVREAIEEMLARSSDRWETG